MGGSQGQYRLSGQRPSSFVECSYLSGGGGSLPRISGFEVHSMAAGERKGRTET